MAALTVQNIGNGGAVTFAAPSASDTADIGTGKDTILIYKVGATATTITVTQPTNLTDYGVAMPAKTFSAVTNSDIYIPLSQSYNNGAGVATVTTSQQVAVTCALVRRP